MDYEKEWGKLVEENDKLKAEYESLLIEIKMLKEFSLRNLYGNGLRYRIAKWLIKK